MSSRVMMSAVCSIALALVAPSQGLEIVRAGQARARVGYPTDPMPFEAQALQELTGTVARMTGVPLESDALAPGQEAAWAAAQRTAGRIPILLGRSAAVAVETDWNDARGVRGAFVLKAGGDGLWIAGNEEGVYYGVLELLEQAGCRWFMPGPLGEVIPRLDVLSIREQTTVQKPSFPSRWFQMPNREWQMRVRCGGEVFAGAHGMIAPPVKVNPATGELEPAEHAEYYALVKGKRTTRQHCVSNPRLIEYMANAILEKRRKGAGPVIGCGPNDGGGFCECPNCQALDSGDFDPFSNERSVTDRYIWFYNRVLEKVLPEFPDTKLAFYIYHTYMRPPRREKPHPHIQGALAPIGLDRVHGFSNPVAPEKSYVRWLFEEWGKIMPELYDRGYWSNLACPGFTFIIVHRLRDEIPVCHDLGVRGWRVETFPNFGPQFPSMYVAARLMWNHRTDVEALLEDCFDKFFGSAAAPMGAYIRLMDAALRDADHCTGSSWDMPWFYPAPLRARARTLLEEGRAKAQGQSPYDERVAVIADAFAMTEAFIEMLEARARNDFLTAQAALERCDAVAEKLMAIQPVPMLSAGRHSTYVNYMRRFFRPATEQGYRRVTGGNELIAAAEDEWAFQIDPARAGEDIGLWRPEITGGNWQRIKTSSSSWSNQGLRYFKGLAWYRQTLTVPARFIGKRIFLWCGGVDETAKVWVNGQVAGISPGAAFYPFEMDVTELVREGPNVIVLCVANLVVNELGTGGLVAPLLLYAPTDPEAKPENIRDLKPTFP